MKTISRILKWIFLSLLGFSLLVFILLLFDRGAQKINLQPGELQSIKVVKTYSNIVRSQQLDSLQQAYGTNKNLAPGFELQCLLALSHYPELKNIPINFLVQPAYIPLSSRPDPASVVFPWVKRKFLVVISNGQGGGLNSILLSKAGFNEQIGVLGHELSHVVFYLDKNALSLANLAIQYVVDQSFRRQFERETDQRAIAHGLGYQMYAHSFFVHKAFGHNLKETKIRQGGPYLGPLEIAREMKKYPFYTEALDSPESYFEQ